MTKTEMVKEILQAGSACQELKDAAQNYLDAVGTADEHDNNSFHETHISF